MKKFLAISLVLSLIIMVLSACGGNIPDPPSNEEPPSVNDTPSDPGTEEPPTNTPGEGTAPDEPEDPPADPAVPPEATMPTLPNGYINAVTDWGITTAAGEGITNGLTLYEKMSTLADGSTVYFPEGVYELDLPLLITGKKNIRIVGYKAVFLNTRATNTAASQAPANDPRIPADMQAATATSGMVWIEGTQNITIEGITFRYATATSLSGEVQSRSSSYVDIKVTDGSAITGDEYVMAINTFTKDGIPDRTLEQYASANFRVEKRNDTTLRVYGINTSKLSNGTRVCLRTSLSSNYIFTIFNSSDLTFRDLTLNNSFNGGFLIEHRTVNAAFERIRVQSHNSGALMSLNADAIHIAGLGGTLTVNDCYFERGGDDFINVHGVAAKPTSVADNTLAFTLSWGADSRWVAAGDVIEFYDPATFALLGEATVTRVNGASVTFDTLPSGVNTDTVMSNKSLHPSVTITDTYARYNRARAFLLQTDDVTIKNCHFLGTALSAILISPDINNWMEMSPARGVEISECTFVACGNEAYAVIQFATDHDDLAVATSAPIHEDIRIAYCTFVSSVPAVYAVGCRNISVAGNFIAEVTSASVLVFDSCADITHDLAQTQVMTRNAKES